MPPDPRRVKELFHAALDLPDPADRPAFLDRECGDDAGLRARLDELLAAHDRPAEALGRPLVDDPGRTADLPGDGPDPTLPATGEPAGAEGPPVTVAGSTADFRPAAPAAVVGSVIAGRYKIRQVIGEGGMGSVYLAEQARPIQRQVALKLIKPGMDSRQVLARFESERQALALMDHPNIARVLDAGSTEAGRPFFVMELVKGVPLTDYCDAHRLDLPSRLAVFRQVCSAVQHAHQKGVIHRDLKPTNILVEAHDGHAVPKVIDFGLAKATSGLPLTDQSLFTAFGSVAGTPLYMAPEQATFNALDVDTRADIYALGVILYELLTGSTPIRRDTVRRAALDEMLRVIREDEPPTPSSRISTSEGLAGIAATRHIEPARLSRFVRGDLDWIVMKALAKERGRRYESAIGLATDIERFISHEPVSAGPPTAGYRARKFIRRHRGQVVAASLVLVALVGGIIGTTAGLIEARRARQAEADQRWQAQSRLDQMVKVNRILGSIFSDLNPRRMEKEGKPLLAMLGERLDNATTAMIGEEIGDPLQVARMQNTLGESQLALGYPEKAIDLFTRCRATFAARLGPEHFETLAVTVNLASGYQVAGKLDLALPLYEQILAITRAKLSPEHHTNLLTMHNLASAYQAAGKLDLAISLYEQALAIKKEKLGPNRPTTVTTMVNLASAYQAAGRLDLALPLYEQALEKGKENLGPEHPDVLVTMDHLASAYQAAGKLDLALPLYEQALEKQKENLGPEHPSTLGTMFNLASAYQAAGKRETAYTLRREWVDHWRHRFGSDSPRFAGSLAVFGSELLAQKSWAEAEPVLREALAIREAKEADAWTTFNSKSLLGGALLGQAKYAEAGPLLVAGYEGMKARAGKIPSAGRIRPGEALDRLIELAEATDKPDEAKAWRGEKARWSAPPDPKPKPGPGPGPGRP